jgi:[acyl-carrier-protein] S-malonyltransferase
MSKTVFLFPGQGAQAVGMGVSQAAEHSEIAAKIFDTAKNTLGYDLYKISAEDGEKLSETLYAQPAIAACSVLSAEIFIKSGITPEAVAGHSLGEYPAMYIAGVISLSDMFALLKIRAAAMQKAAKTAGGVMYAVIGSSVSAIHDACDTAKGYCVPVNYNSAAQIVIAGEEAAAAETAKILTDGGAKCIKLGVAAAFHSDLMKSAYDEFLSGARDFTFSKPKIAFYSNITGSEISDITAENLAKHIVWPVCFSDELVSLYENGFDSFYECGPGKTLSGFVKKTLKGVTTVNG